MTLCVEANLGVFQVEEESGLELGCRKADLCSTVRVVLTIAGYSLQGQQAASSQPPSRNQEAEEIHRPFAPLLANNAAAEGSLVRDKNCIVILIL